ncbi:MAG: iron chaperone [Anaerotignaceae bacterium]
MPRPTYYNIDEYIATCEPKVQAILQELRTFIKQHVPDAIEIISWSMPTFYLNGNLVHFMAHKKHIGLYPGVSGVDKFAEELKACGFKYSKGTIQFPLDKPLPWDIIEKIIKFRVGENS